MGEWVGVSFVRVCIRSCASFVENLNFVVVVVRLMSTLPR